jgi:hypothetical protein
MYLFSASLATWLQFQIEFVGRPKFDERGGVLDPGSDLAQLGMTEYMFDVLYLTWGIQLLVAFTTTWAWWLYSLVCCSFLRVGGTHGVDSVVCGHESLGVLEGTEGCCACGRGSPGETNSIAEKSGGKTVTYRTQCPTILKSYPVISNGSQTKRLIHTTLSNPKSNTITKRYSPENTALNQPYTAASLRLSKITSIPFSTP